MSRPNKHVVNHLSAMDTDGGSASSSAEGSNTGSFEDHGGVSLSFDSLSIGSDGNGLPPPGDNMVPVPGTDQDGGVPIYNHHPTLPGANVTAPHGQTQAVQAQTNYTNGNEDPQSRHPTAAAVFVANLPSSQTDDAIAAALTRQFSRFGNLWVKIKREGRGMPFAFLQYERVQDAQQALRNGRGLDILGRPCRVERVRANNCEFIISRIDGSDMEMDAAREIMSQFGNISFIEPLAYQFQSSLRLTGTAIFLRYTHFDPDRNIPSVFANDPRYRVDRFQNVLSSRDCSDNRQRQARNIDDDERNRAYLRRYDQNCRSAWVGNIPLNVSEGDLARVFSQVGEVRVVTIRHQSIRGHGVRSYAFVEFVQRESATSAIEKLNGTQPFPGVDRMIVRPKRDEQSNSIAPVSRQIAPAPPALQHNSGSSSSSPDASGQSSSGSSPVIKEEDEEDFSSSDMMAQDSSPEVAADNEATPTPRDMPLASVAPPSGYFYSPGVPAMSPSAHPMMQQMHMHPFASMGQMTSMDPGFCPPWGVPHHPHHHGYNMPAHPHPPPMAMQPPPVPQNPMAMPPMPTPMPNTMAEVDETEEERRPKRKGRGNNRKKGKSNKN